MKKAGLIMLCGLLAAVFIGWSQSASARPQYKKEHDAKYKDSKIAGALKEAKCNACHYGKSKKNRNDYGKALEKSGLSKKSYTELKSDKPALAKHVKEALEKVLKEKNADGETFGDRIKAGKLPGTAPKE